jgi:2-haloacid dehalogenase
LPVAYVFDAYGTLFDVHAAVARHRERAGPDAERLSDLWRLKQLEYTWTLTLSQQYSDFWALTERALDFALARMPSIDSSLKPLLLDAYLTLDAFADATGALRALVARGERCAVLSNGSPGMLDAAVASAGVGDLLDVVLSADAVRMYKPRAEVYSLVTDHYRCAPADIVFVSANRWDVMGGMHYGFDSVWINRAGSPDEYGRPHRSLPDLASLPKLSF